MFSLCNSLASPPDISKWNTTNVKKMNGMFKGCKSLISFPDISKWNTNNVTDISWMFESCDSLKKVGKKTFLILENFGYNDKNYYYYN